MLGVEELVRVAQASGASDIHIICGMPIKYRLDGELENMSEEPLNESDCLGYARELAKDGFEELMKSGELDAADTFAGIRCRIHIFKQKGIPSVALRLLREDIPELDKLGLPPAVFNLPNLHKGIVLVTGETGSGKSTTLAALLDSINHTRKSHIVTLEDPIEYVYKPDLCAINQREVGPGKDTRSFAYGLRASLREDPDVILIGEMRDPETIETAITAAETGHLVFGTLHTGSAADSIDRIVQVFPENAQPQIRLQLSMTLEAVLTQQLIKKKTGGRVLACEMMIVTDAIRNMIRTSNTPQIVNAIATSAELGGQTMDQALVRLVRMGQISREMALHYCKDELYIKKNAI